jgi:hypothetical protein
MAAESTGGLVQSKTVLYAWLRAQGFPRHPFEHREAASEREHLSEYFVPYPYFDEIKGLSENPRTAILFGARGCGKSANRVMIESVCQPSDRSADIFGISYTDFSLLAEAVDDGGVSSRQHLRCILGLGVQALIRTLQETPSLAGRLYPEDWALVKRFALDYSDILSPHRLARRLRGINLVPAACTPAEFYAILKEGRLAAALDEHPVPHPPASDIWVTLTDVKPLPPEGSSPSPARLLADLAHLTQQIGMKALYVLVDGLDEFPATAAAPAVSVALLEPLMADLRLMEMDGVAFKFFLPTEIVDELRATPSIRLDRLLFREIIWTEPDLLEMLRSRLLAFSGGRHDSLEPLCRPELRGRIDQVLVDEARRSPRNLLRLGELLLSEHCRLPVAEDDLIGEAVLKAALTKFSQEQQIEQAQPASAPVETPRSFESQIGLRVDLAGGQVFIDGQVLAPPLTGQEYRFLQYLFERRGEVCRRDDIIDAVWGRDQAGGVSEQALDQLASRVRRRIEPEETGSPRFLITVRGRGYQLVDES